MLLTEGKKNILLGVTGSIAAYKAIELVRIIKQRGMDVKVIMTQSACEFVSPLTFETVSGAPVVTNLWEQNGMEGISHVELGAWADAYVIVPATADTIAKIAHGHAENELLATMLVTRAPILIAPAMNTNMYLHPATQENVKILEERGIEIVEPAEGDLACGWNGTGRLADVYEIFYRILRLLTPHDYKKQKIVITAGPTREMIDPVRFLSNCSSGKMGVALADEAFLRGAEVVLIHGPANIKVPSEVKCIKVQTAEEMRAAVIEETFEQDKVADILIMAAAVADVRAKNVEENKIKNTGEWTNLDLEPNPDILAEVGKKRGEKQDPYLIGFAVETCEPEELLDSVKEKIVNKKVDIIVGNLAQDAFDKNTNHVWIVNKSGKTKEITTTHKSRIARKIFDYIAKRF